MYGYQMTQQVKKHSNGLYTILEGSMYPVLYRLEEQGYISYYEQKAGKQQTRVYYRLEDPGREYWEEVHSAYELTLSVINFLCESKEGDVFDYEENGNKKL